MAKSYRGSLDFLEYVIGPDNHDTAYPGGIGECISDYLKILGMNEKRQREWILEKLKEERKKRVLKYGIRY